MSSDPLERFARDLFAAMLEIRAERGGRTPHNFAAFLARTSEGQVVEPWMVDAKPAYGDECWS